jgi:hypothetical protein
MIIKEFTIAEVMEMEELKNNNKNLYNMISQKAIQDFIRYNDLDLEEYSHIDE